MIESEIYKYRSDSLNLVDELKLSNYNKDNKAVTLIGEQIFIVHRTLCVDINKVDFSRSLNDRYILYVFAPLVTLSQQSCTDW